MQCNAMLPRIVILRGVRCVRESKPVSSRGCDVMYLFCLFLYLLGGLQRGREWGRAERQPAVEDEGGRAL